MCKQLLLFAQTTCSFWTQKNVLAYDVVYQCGGASGTPRTREAYPHGVGCIRWFGPARTAASFHRARRVVWVSGTTSNKRWQEKQVRKLRSLHPSPRLCGVAREDRLSALLSIGKKNVGPAIQKQKHSEA